MTNNQQRKRGRPESNDSEALSLILKDEKTYAEFIAAIDNLVFHKRKIEADTLLYKEDISAVSEKFGISKGLLNTKISSIVKENVEEVADKALATHEFLTEV